MIEAGLAALLLLALGAVVVVRRRAPVVRGPLDLLPAPLTDEDRFLRVVERGGEATSGRTAQDPSYPHKDVRCGYRSEQLEVTPDEAARLAAWLAADQAADAAPPRVDPPVRRPLPLLLDTDIGTDVDDALALLMLLHLPPEDVELLGVTTVYGHAPLRAAVAERVVRAFAAERGRRPVPVVTGECTPLGTHRPVWHTGTEGLGVLREAELTALMDEADFLPGRAPREWPAARFLVDETARRPGEVTLVCVGPLTNLARALALDPTLPARLPRVVVMGLGGRHRAPHAPGVPFAPPADPITPGRGLAYGFYPNHNLSADTLAAARVFASDLRIDVVDDHVTTQLWWGRGFDDDDPDEDPEAASACLELLDAEAPPEAVVVGRLLREWLTYRSTIFRQQVRGTCPHDALAVAEAVYPGRFVQPTPRGHLLVHAWAAFGTFVCAPAGPHRLGATVRRDEFLRFLTGHLRPTRARPT